MLLRSALPLAFAAALLAESAAPSTPKTEREKTYAEKIAPLMERSCVSCHGPKKAKGRFRADSLASLVKGGEESGAGITWGKPRESSVYLLAAANRSEKLAMPPKKSDKPALSPAELETLKAWIESSK